MNVLNSLWFTNPDGCVGIVIVEDEITGEREAYVGRARGLDQQSDIERITDWGGILSLDAIRGIERHLTKGGT